MSLMSNVTNLYAETETVARCNISISYLSQLLYSDALLPLGLIYEPTTTKWWNENRASQRHINMNLIEFKDAISHSKLT